MQRSTKYFTPPPRTKRNRRVYRKAVINALNQELRCKSMIKNHPNPTKAQLWKDHFYIKAAARAQEEAIEILLTMYCIANRIDLDDEHPVPDQDRVAVCEAIRSNLPLKYIKLVLEDYPKACESGGCVDHISHPIHVACTHYRAVVYYILELYPDSVNQPNEKGQLPFELFIENEDLIDISSETFLSTTNLFTSLNPTKSREIYSSSRESLKHQIITNCILPSHLDRQGSHGRFSSNCSTSHDDESSESLCINHIASSH